MVLQGPIKKISVRIDHSTASSYDLAFTIVDQYGRLAAMIYRYGSEEIATAVRDSIAVGEVVRLTTEKPEGPGPESYRGVGSIVFVRDELIRNADPQTEVLVDKPEFTDIEIGLLQSALAKTKEAIRSEFNPPSARMEHIEERLDELIERIEVEKRFDWVSLLTNCMVSIAVDLGLGATSGETILNLFKNILTELGGHTLKRELPGNAPD